MYYAVELVGRSLCVGPLGRDELVAFAQSLFLGDGEQVYVPEALELAGEGVAFFVRVLPMLFGFLAGGLQGGAPLRLYLLAGFGGGGLGPGHLFGDALGVRAGGGEFAREIDGPAREGGLLGRSRRRASVASPLTFRKRIPALPDAR